MNGVEQEELAQDDDPEMSVSLPASSPPASPSRAECSSKVFSGNAYLSNQGDVVVNETVVLSVAQRLVLDQQMRQFVQLMTQHFLQTYEHPMLHNYSPTCKKQLVCIYLTFFVCFFSLF